MTPTHVVWNQRLWFQLEQASEQVEYETMKNSSRLLLSLYPKAKHMYVIRHLSASLTDKSSIRGTTSMIENVDCYDHLVGQDDCIRESNTARRVYEEELVRSPQASLAWMETLKYVDARPETTRDGRHYTQEFKGHEYSAETQPERPRVGETDIWLMDLTFEIWAKHMRM
ncbi:hypothetical protein BCR37DRAFT_1633 [Protomyces lactucae-debilis]|uniref:Uncharacterized protein n=1 Tax=Protomyces lactucae-debilis TaxID=2754530 RepID=A0A1Y2FWC1_PROLT|nr:uncharacterized protein BCR37DRAFT_1633 [Protomyces lactucae-debilis]ORY87594.1 hypothetical protein BCR37DRAFT_1633 [Protomyces lactucae-debilis]